MPTTEETIIEMEREALERWGNGDPDGFLEISAEDVVYFDPYREVRVDGREALRELYEELRGKVWTDSFELLNPKIQLGGDLAVLTFNYVSYNKGVPMRWNCTEGYRQKAGGDWEIIQTHWSYTCHPGIVGG